MRNAQSVHRRSHTVAVERNQYGAVTPRTAAGHTYQIVAATSPAVADRLAELSVDSRVMGVDSGPEADRPDYSVDCDCERVRFVYK